MREEPPVPVAATAWAVFEAILAGASAQEVQPIVGRLAREEFYTLMCTLCLVHQEVAGVCTDRADEMEALLGAHCHHYSGGQRTCGPGERGATFPIL